MTLHLETMGQGDELAFIHGWGMNSSVWQDVAQSMQDNYRVTLLDLPGHGKSELPRDQYDLDLLSREIAAALPDNTNLVGWSLGGMVAMNIALQYPEKVKRLALVASNPQFVKSADWPYAMDEKVLQQFADGLEQDYEATVARFLMLQARGGDNVKETVRILRERLTSHGMAKLEALKGGLNILHHASLVDRLEQLQCPSLLMMGRLDALVPVKASENILSHMHHAQLHVFEHSAHAPFISHQNEFLEVLTNFLKA